jgi:hypothetical protein
MISRTAVIKFVLCGILMFGFGLVILNFISYGRRHHEDALTENKNLYALSRSATVTSNEIKPDYKSDTKPAKLIVDNSKIGVPNLSIRKYKISLNNTKVLFIVKDFQKSYCVYLASNNSCS